MSASFLEYKDVDAAFWSILSSQWEGEAVSVQEAKQQGFSEPDLQPPVDYAEEAMVFKQQWEDRFATLTPAPEERASLFSKYFFTWLNPTITLAHDEALEEEKFPPPSRHHRARMAGSRLSNDFRQREMMDGGLLWSDRVEHTILSSGKDGCPAEVQVIPNPLSEVAFVGESQVKGRLRWVGQLSCCCESQHIYAGVEWNLETPAYRSAGTHGTGGESTNGNGSGLHRGSIHGEQLFYQVASTAAPRCSIEPVHSIELMHPVHRSHSKSTSRPPPSHPRRPNLVWSLWRVFKADLLGIFPAATVQLFAFNLASPLLIRWYVQYLEQSDASAWAGIGLLLLFFVIKGVEPLASNKYEQRAERVAALFRTACLSVVFEKCLTISTDSYAKPEINAGRVLTMASSDVENIKDFPRDMVHLIMAPAILFFCLGMMLYLLGWCALGGVVMVVLLLPIQGLLVKWQERYQKLCSAETDVRLRKTNEMLSGIRVVKMMSWEKEFYTSIQEARERELSFRRRLQMIEVLVTLAIDGTSMMVLMSVVTLYILTGHQLTPDVALPVVAMLGSLMFGLMMLPTAANTTVKFFVSCRRLSRFLECDDATEAVKQLSERAEDREWSAVFQHATFSAMTVDFVVKLMAPPRGFQLPHWVRRRLPCAPSHSTPVEMQWSEVKEELEQQQSQQQGPETVVAVTDQEDEEEDGETTGPRLVSHTVLKRTTLLKDLQLAVPRKGLTVVIGATGSGKSVLMESLLNCFSLSQESGGAWTSKSIAYVPQQAWIMQDTIRFNITFFADEAETDGKDGRLQRVVRKCQLEEDLKATPQGLDSEIGERGVNLSGGQKARISLARALYSDRELYLLDDPLAALDAHVGDRILHDVILGELQDKAVVLVTHHLQCLSHADRVVVMENGAIKFNGTYDELLRSEVSQDLSSLAPAQQECREDDESAEPILDDLISSPLRANTGVREEEYPPASEMLSRQATSVSSMEGSTIHRSSSKEDASNPQWMVEEEKETGSVPWRIYRTYIKAGGGFSLLFKTLGLYFVWNMLMTIASAWLSLWSSGSFSLPDKACLGIYLVLQMSCVFLSPVSRYYIFMFNRNASRSLHHQLLSAISVGTLHFYDTVPLGRILNRFSKDLSVIDNEMPHHMSFLSDICFYALTTIALAIASLPLVFVFVAIAAVGFILLLRYYASLIREVRRRSSIAQSPMYSMLESLLDSGKSTLMAYGRLHLFFDLAMQRLDTLYSCTYVEKVMDQWLSIRVEYLGAFVMFSVALLGVGQKIYHGGKPLSSESVALISLSLTMSFDLFWSLPLIVKVAAWLEAAMNSTQRVKYYVDTVSREQIYLLPEADAAVQQAAAAAAAQPDSNAVVAEFSNMSMRYREDLPCVLRNISFVIRAKEKIGVVGRTGSGKSSMLLTFMRLVNPCGGDILIHGKSSLAMSLTELRRHFALIPQDPVLFEGTIRSNLDPFHESSDEEVTRVLELIGLCRDGSREGGLAPQTSVSEGGKNFSVGQRQLLCMGRALLKKGISFVLMDEATANVDPQLDLHIQEVIRTCFAPYVVVTIAHRLHTVAAYDRIIVLHKGEVVEEGKPRDLMRDAQSNLYQMVARTAAKSTTPEQHEKNVSIAVADFTSKCL